jgi:hypothetical protein
MPRPKVVKAATLNKFPSQRHFLYFLCFSFYAHSIELTLNFLLQHEQRALGWLAGRETHTGCECFQTLDAAAQRLLFHKVSSAHPLVTCATLLFDGKQGGKKLFSSSYLVIIVFVSAEMAENSTHQNTSPALLSL